ncbi:2-hydroxychromene-2-carboxylate isomerase [Pyronema domesticum]|uniref:Glutathione S-transferase kappa n=1 Tax=Pyronema omphalodes (strain CBS 100304) TaxID=1076935 RepID=U4LVB4_PYROM|nr:2-hydroxychromene-2-carboxylate isomerase [Pyronema domesticum]CCX32386.1 Similar to Glutathione s-transferase kappa 2; acc. no. Q18973 [Pyronema omphalodes CBS 100304]
MASITLYADIVSPFAYLAFHQLINSPTLAPLTTVTPVFLGGIMRATTNSPPLKVPLKGKYTFHDLHRQARIHNIPVLNGITPEGFPVNTIFAQRLLCVVAAKHPKKLVDTISALYDAHWVSGLRVDQEEVVEKAISGVLGDATKSVLEAAKGEEAKKKLLDNTGEAVAKGCFGLPWFVVKNAKGEEDVWWGFDHLKQVEAFVKGEDLKLSRL